MNLTKGELGLLIDGLSDDVSFLWVLIHLGIRSNPPPRPEWTPDTANVNAAFASLRKLTELGLIRVGRIEYIDGGPPGRLSPVEHIKEEMDTIVSRVEKAILAASKEIDWAFSCWVVNTDLGNEVASRALKQEQKE